MSTPLDPPELVQAFNEFLQQEQPAYTPEYKLYYDETGKPTFMSMEDVPGTYIVVSKEVYNKPNFNIMRVVNGELKYINTESNEFELTKQDTGYTSVKGHAGILADDQTTMETQTYGYKSNN